MTRKEKEQIFLVFSPVFISGSFLLWFVLNNPGSKNLGLALTTLAFLAFVAVIQLRRINKVTSNKPGTPDQTPAKTDVGPVLSYHRSISDLIGKPLATTIGFVNLLSAQLSSRSDDQVEILDTITSALSQIVLLSREIQDYKYREIVKPFDIHQVVDDAIALLAPILQKRRISIVPIFDQRCRFKVEAQYDRTCVLIFNLLLNHILTGEFKENSSFGVYLVFAEKQRALNISLPAINLGGGSDRLKSLIVSSNSSVTNTTLSVPVREPVREPVLGTVRRTLTGTQTPYSPIRRGLTAYIFSNDPLETQGLTSRLNNLDIGSADDVRDADFCLICLTDHDDIKKLTTGLARDTIVFLLKNTTLYHQKNWCQLKDPLNQRELVQAFVNHGGNPNSAINVLVVDDEETNLQLQTLMLEELGYQVTSANNATDAISIIDRAKIDLVLMDVQMPVITGMEACRLMRQAGFTGPVIALSAHLSELEKTEVSEAGMNEALIKPVSKTSLKQMIDSYLLEADIQPAVSEPPEGDIFDEQLAMRRANYRKDLASELLQLLIESLPDDQRKLNNAYANHNKDIFRRQVHKIHGALRYCGVPRLDDAIENLEEVVKQENSLLSNEIKTSLRTTNEEINALCNWYYATQASHKANTT